MKTLVRLVIATPLLASLAGCAAGASVGAERSSTPNTVEPTEAPHALPRNGNPPPEPGPGAPRQRL